MPLINFMLSYSTSHPNSQTLKQIGIEFTAFLLYMTENERGKHAFETVGHYTKDEDEILRLLHNLLAISGDKNQGFLKP